MAYSLTALLVSQKYGDNFDFPQEKLGKDIVTVPDYNNFSPNAFGESDYPVFSPDELPADVVKGTLPFTKRPFIAVRYALAERENNGEYVAKVTDKVVSEVFFQRHKANTPLLTTYNTTPANDGTPQLTTTTVTPAALTSKDTDLTALKKWWSTANSHDNDRAIYTGSGLKDEHWQVLKNILEAKPLEETEGRYLPCYRTYMSQNTIKA